MDPIPDLDLSAFDLDPVTFDNSFQDINGAQCRLVPNSSNVGTVEVVYNITPTNPDTQTEGNA